MAPIRAFTPCRAQGPRVHKSFKTVSQLLENPYLYFCLANAGPLPSLPATPKQNVPVHLPKSSTVHPLLV